MAVEVVCALIVAEGKVLAAQRGAHMRHALQWEFPGGKIESGETPEQALQREIREELGLDIEVLQSFSPYTHTYPHTEVRLHPFVAHISGGQLTLHEHAQVQWVAPAEWPLLDWVEADIPLLERVRQIV